MEESSDSVALYELARKIANQKAGGRYYREDVISDAYLAVADGANSQQDIENAVRQSLNPARLAEKPLLGLGKGATENSEQPTEASLLLGTNPFPEALPHGALIPRRQLPAPGIGRRIAGPKTTKQDLYELARKIASQKAGRRYYRDDVISEAYLAVAKGKATDKRGIENAVRRSLRSEWKQEDELVHEDRRGEWNDEDGHVPFRIENIGGWGAPGAPERAKPDLYAAFSALTEKQRTAVILIYWEGLTQHETADAMGVDQTVVRDHLRAAIRAMKKFLTAPPKM